MTDDRAYSPDELHCGITSDEIKVRRLASKLARMPWTDESTISALGQIRSIDAGPKSDWGNPTWLYDLLDELSIHDLGFADNLDCNGQETGRWDLVEYREIMTCDTCGEDGFRGEHPGHGDLVADVRGYLTCDDCASIVPALDNAGTACGLNADWSGLTWHLGPSDEPNHVDGDLYITDNEDGSYSLVCRYYVDGDNDRIDEIATTANPCNPACIDRLVRLATQIANR